MIDTQLSQASTLRVNMNANGVARSFAAEPRTTLLDACVGIVGYGSRPARRQFFIFEFTSIYRQLSLPATKG